MFNYSFKNALFFARNKVHKINLVVNDMPLSPHFGYDHLELYCGYRMRQISLANTSKLRVK